MNDKLLEKSISLAEFRFGLIAPVINQTYEDKSERAYFERLCKRCVTTPDGRQIKLKVPTLKTRKRNYIRQGFEGLMPSARSDKDSSRRINSELACIIDDIRKKYPKMPATSILEKLICDGDVLQGEMSECTMQRYCKNHPVSDISITSKKDRRAFEAGYVNEIWQADTLYGPYIKNQRTYLQSIIDDKSRKIVSSKFYLQDSAANFQSTLKSAIQSHGIPKILYVDNGSPYRNMQLSLICGELSINLCHAQVRDGAAKGKIERFNRTLRMKFLNCLDMSKYQSIDALNDALFSWIQDYNNTSHKALCNSTPVDVFINNSDAINWFDGSQEDLDKKFLNRIYRKVHKDATIQIDKTLYDVPLEYIGCKIEVRFIPNEIDNVWMVRENNTLSKLYLTDKVANSKAPRKRPKYRIDYSEEV